jgi:hypothetical protein
MNGKDSQTTIRQRDGIYNGTDILLSRTPCFEPSPWLIRRLPKEGSKNHLEELLFYLDAAIEIAKGTAEPYGGPSKDKILDGDNEPASAQ